MTDILREKISARAFAIWEEEGRPDGRDLEHWIQAELEITAAAKKPAKKPAEKKAAAKPAAPKATAKAPAAAKPAARKKAPAKL